MKRMAAICGLLGLVWCTVAEADVVIDRGRQVFFGTLVSVPQGVALEAGGETLTWPSSAVDRQGDNAALLADQTLAVHLRDGSVIRGVYRDYDEGVGLFLRIAFGVLTVPIAHIDHIELASTPAPGGSVGALPGVSAASLVWIPLNAPNLGLGAGGLLATTQPLPWGRGWSLQQEVEYVLLTNSVSPQVDYRWVGASLGVRSEVLWWWNQTPPGEWSPFVGVNPGFLMVAVEDHRTNAQNTHYGSINLRVTLEIGVAWTTPWPGWALEAGVAGALVGQETAPLWLAGFRIDAVYHLSN